MLLLHLLCCTPCFAGHVVAWGGNLGGQTNVPAGLTNVVAVAAGNYHTVALRNDGTVVQWGGEGSYDFGQGPVPIGLTNVISVACGFFHSAALKSDGTVVCWGPNTLGQTEVPPGLSNVIAITCGSAHTLALKADGRVAGWGHNDYLQARPPAGLRAVIGVAAGDSFSLALKSGGDLIAWGITSLADRTNDIVAIAAGQSFSVALLKSGEVRAWGYNGDGQTNVPSGLSNVVAISARTAHALALRGNGLVQGWGLNDFGQATPPAGLTNVVAIAAGYQHSVAVVENTPGITVIRQPSSLTLTTNESLLLNAAAVSDQSISYQWKRSSTNVAGATNSWLCVPAQPANRGDYTVLITTPFAMSASVPARLRVVAPQLLLPPRIDPQAGITLTFGDTDGTAHLPDEWQYFRTQVSTNLIKGSDQRVIWLTLTNQPVLTNGLFSVRDLMTPLPQQGVYRVLGNP